MNNEIKVYGNTLQLSGTLSSRSAFVTAMLLLLMILLPSVSGAGSFNWDVVDPGFALSHVRVMRPDSPEQMLRASRDLQLASGGYFSKDTLKENLSVLSFQSSKEENNIYSSDNELLSAFKPKDSSDSLSWGAEDLLLGKDGGNEVEVVASAASSQDELQEPRPMKKEFGLYKYSLAGLVILGLVICRSND